MSTARTLGLVLLAAWLAAGCLATAEKGFTVPGCYDYRGILEPSIPTAAECRVQGWEWHTQDWKKQVPAPPPARSTR